MNRGQMSLRCEKCVSEERLALKKNGLLFDKAAVETIDMGDFEPETLPKTG